MLLSSFPFRWFLFGSFDVSCYVFRRWIPSYFPALVLWIWFMHVGFNLVWHYLMIWFSELDMMCVLQELVQRREVTTESAVRTAAALLALAPRNRVCYDVWRCRSTVPWQFQIVAVPKMVWGSDSCLSCKNNDQRQHDHACSTNKTYWRRH